MTAQTPQTTAQTPPRAQQSAAPRSGSTIVPTPQPNEINTFLTQQAANALPPMPWHLKPDGSPVSPGAFNPSQGSPTWP
jgi:hypothetical protein